MLPMPILNSVADTFSLDIFSGIVTCFISYIKAIKQTEN